MQMTSLSNLLKILRIDATEQIEVAFRAEIESKSVQSECRGLTAFHCEDSFDEKYFGMKVGKVIDVETSGKQTSGVLDQFELELPYAYTIARLSASKFWLIQSLLRRDWLLLDTTVDLVCKVNESSLNVITTGIESASAADLPSLLECRSVFSHGRLFTDPLFSNGESLYADWIQNSFEKKVALDLFVLRGQGDRLEGFATIKEHVIADLKYWEVPLLAKHPQARRNGVATALLGHICNQARKNGVLCVTIGTHGENIMALRTYTTAGFRPFDTGMTLRLYKPHLAKGV